MCGRFVDPHSSASERAVFTARRKAAYEALHPETRHGAIGNGREKSGQLGQSSFSEDQAEKTGQAERTIRRDAERGSKVCQAALDVLKGTGESGLADLAEFAENLHRRELGEVERAELMARWVEIAARRPVQDKPAQVGQVSTSGGRGKKGGVSQAARDLGVTRQSVERSIKIASLSPEAKAAGRDAPQAALLAAAKEKEPAARVAVIDSLQASSATRPQNPHQLAACSSYQLLPRPAMQNSQTQRRS